jgi:single-stranded DNA-binding protein
MITITAVGFIPEKPAVVLVGTKRARKCEFDVVWARRVWTNGEWRTCWERATFMAWDDEAEKVAERLDKGNDVTCIGTQETSEWMPSGATKKERRVKYALVSWVKYPKQAANRQEGHGQDNARSRPPASEPLQQQNRPAEAAPAPGNFDGWDDRPSDPFHGVAAGGEDAGGHHERAPEPAAAPRFIEM